MSLVSGRVLNERYRLIKPLGQGSQAAVWVAEHLALSTQVAVKLIDPELAKKEDARERFRREATAAAQLRSAHVVQILDHGIDETQAFIVMELLEGEDLFERIQKRGRLSVRETSKIVTQVARALTRAHAAKIVHRDLKPENVFLVSNEDDEIIKVLDFGVAKVIDPAKRTMQRTGIGTLIGTPHYMSPEQVKGIAEVDYRSDLWSLGVIAYQCVTGELPFDSEGVGDLLLKITIGDMPVPSKIVPSLPASFDEWFAKACNREPSRRFESSRDMAEALARAVGMTAEIEESSRYRFGPVLAAARAAAKEGRASMPSAPLALVPRSKPTSDIPGAEALDSHHLEEVTDIDEAAPVTESGRGTLESTDIDVEESLGSSRPPPRGAGDTPHPAPGSPMPHTAGAQSTARAHDHHGDFGEVGSGLREVPGRSLPRSTVSGLSSPQFGSVAPPPELDGTRRRRMIALVSVGFLAVAGIIGYRAVQPYLGGAQGADPTSPETPPRSTANEGPPVTMVDPGQPDAAAASAKVTPQPPQAAGSFRPRGKPGARDKKGRPGEDPVIQYDTPEEEAPAAPAAPSGKHPAPAAPPPDHGSEPEAPPAGI